ncbi:MAG TPA: hypothetical protein ENI27_03440 [bacterium]|nr:hypothetical protein [bacterium]
MAIAIIKKDWGSTFSVFGVSSSKNALTSTTPNWSTSPINLFSSGWDGAAVTARVVMSGTRADVTLEVAASFTTDSGNRDTTPLFSQQLSVATSTNQITFIVRDVPYAWINLEAGATGDAHVGWVHYRPFRYRSS